MAAPAARIERGTFTDSPCVQESNLLIQSVKAKSSRENKFWADITTGADVIGRGENASLTWSIAGWVKTAAGFVTQGVGTTITTLANFAATFRGFDPTVGIIIFDDPEDDWEIRDLRKCSFTAMHKPYIA